MVKGCHSNTFCTMICDHGQQQVNGQGSFKAKDNGQTFLVDGQSYVNKVVHKNIAKYSKNKWNEVKGQDKIIAKVNSQS